MATIFALENLFDLVVARFAIEGVQISNKFGWREPYRQLGRPAKIVWVPGDPSGDLGELKAPKYPGQNPRPLQNLEERFHVFISGSDASDPNNERKQYNATRLLYDIWIRAVYLAAHGTFNVSNWSSVWVIDKNERRYGAAIRVSATIQATILDSVLPVIPVDTSAHITPTLDPDGTGPDPGTNDPVLIITAGP